MEGRKEGRAEEGRAHNANRKHMLLEVGVLAVRDGKAAERKPASSAIPAERRLLWWDAVALSAEVGDPTLRECFMPASKGGEQPRETNPCTPLSEGGDGTIEITGAGTRRAAPISAVPPSPRLLHLVVRTAAAAVAEAVTVPGAPFLRVPTTTAVTKETQTPNEVGDRGGGGGHPTQPTFWWGM